MILPVGGQVNGTQAGANVITLFPGHGFRPGDKIMFKINEAKFFALTDLATEVTDTTVRLALGATVDVTDGDIAINMGNDTGVSAPAHDSTTVPIYSSVDNASASTPSRVTSNATTGAYKYWTTEKVVWELVLNAANTSASITRHIQCEQTVDYVEEEITLSTSGLTTDSAQNLLPANSLIEGVAARITETITTTTNWALGDANESARFSSANATLTADTTSVGLNHYNPTNANDNLGPVQASAASLRITCTGSNPGAGKIRVRVYFRKYTPPSE